MYAARVLREMSRSTRPGALRPLKRQENRSPAPRSCAHKVINKTMRCRECIRKRHDGFTILEVLVSLVILSIGLLGTAKLMLYSSHANDSAYLRSQATELAYEILDNMRANRQQALAGAYTTALGAVPVNPGFLCLQAIACTQSN